MFSSSGIDPPDIESAATRPRNRRPNTGAAAPSSSVARSSPGHADSTYASLRTDPRNGDGGGREAGWSASLLSPTASSWVPNWSSIQGFASTLLAGNGTVAGSGPRSRNTTGPTSYGGRKTASARKLPEAWGPAPPSDPPSSRPRLQDVAAGQAAAREAELKARKTASVLESHPGVNGGLDIRGQFKRRTSDDNLRASGAGTGEEVEDCLVYIHRVQASDTYFGIVLKYRCREDAFRRANGLWTRDNVQIRKWLALPVDACEIKGRPCDDPSLFPQGVDLLAPTPKSSQQQSAQPGAGSSEGADYFGISRGGPGTGTGTGTPNKSAAEEAAEPPWTHVRWVRLDSCPEPVEIVRMSRTALGYFPPRRKKSIRGSVSTVSTPRASLDVTIANSPLPDRPVTDSPNRTSRRPSLLGSRTALGTSLMSSSPSRHLAGISKTSAPVDTRPEWMRRPGGVGSMSKSVRAPGPARDSLNKWTTKHLPGLNIETMPSMSVMGSETAHFGFGSETPEIVESSFEDGREAASANPKDSGLDKAAASIETWLRGAFTKGAGTPSAAGTPLSSFAGRIGRQLEETLGDLIELEDGPLEDAVSGSGGGFPSSVSARPTLTSGWRADSEGSVRGRSNIAGSGRSSATAKGKKAD